MKVLFFGTPEFAAVCLEKILLTDHEIAGVVCQPDKPRGRGRKVAIAEVKQAAIEKKLKILQPENLKDPFFLNELKTLEADFFCVVAFRILPEEIFSMPPKGCVNLHASLLPKYRGAAPINWALINGENETGLTTFFIRKKIDTGDILMQRKIAIGPDETFDELYGRMAEAGGDLIVETMSKIESGDYSTIKQNDKEASKAPKIYPELGKIDWKKSANEIHNLIRGLTPKPGAYTVFSGNKIIIVKSKVVDNPDNAGPGKVLLADPKKGLIVGCGKRALELLQVKPASRKVMTGAEFVRGKRIKEGILFGEEI